VENRIINQYDGTGTRTYDPSGKRVAQWDGTNGTRLNFYGIAGQRLGTYTLSSTGTGFSTSSLNLYFGSKLIRSAGVTVATDRLGSVRANINGERMSYWPYGQERTGTADGREKFATYLRDPGTGTDYADQRYYNFGYGRFQTSDPSKGVDLKNPITWNKYTYAGNDPVNFNDRRGLMMDLVDDFGGGGWFGDLGPMFGPYDSWFDAANPGTVLWDHPVGPMPGGGGGGGSKTVSSPPAESCTFAMVFDNQCDGSMGPLGAVATPLSRLLGAAGAAWWASAQILGDISEALVGDALGGVPKNNQLLVGTNVIPDFVNVAAGLLAEVKYVGSLAFTQQIKTMYDWGVANNVKLQLWIGQSTQLSSTLENMKNSGQIIVNYIPYLP
jgi:RHS repeat-associated protein